MIHIHHYVTVGRTEVQRGGFGWLYILECRCGKRRLECPDKWEDEMHRLLPEVYCTP